MSSPLSQKVVSTIFSQTDLSSETDSALWSACCDRRMCLRRVSKNCVNLFLSELRQISTHFDTFWHKDGKWAEIMRRALIFHIT